MNALQRAKVIAVIKRDANGTDFLLDRFATTKKYCVVGGLLSAAGVPDDTLGGRMAASDQEMHILRRTYGLSQMMVGDLIHENDQWKTTPARRKRLIERVKTFPLTKKSGGRK